MRTICAVISIICAFLNAFCAIYWHMKIKKFNTYVKMLELCSKAQKYGVCPKDCNRCAWDTDKRF